MNRTFYIFRHGETDWNKDRRCQGHTNIPLNNLGHAQARELAMKMLATPLEIIYSSDLDRAFETGNYIALKKNISIIKDARLREMSYGEVEGKMYQDTIKIYGEEFYKKLHSFRKSNDHIGFPGGETRGESRERLLSFIHEIILTTSFKNIGISTHGGALRNLLHAFLPEDHEILPIPNCVVYKLEYHHDSNNFKVMTKPF